MDSSRALGSGSWAKVVEPSRIRASSKASSMAWEHGAMFQVPGQSPSTPQSDSTYKEWLKAEKPEKKGKKKTLCLWEGGVPDFEWHTHVSTRAELPRLAAALAQVRHHGVHRVAQQHDVASRLKPG